MVEAVVGEIRMFGGNFPPKNWAYCDGQLIPISDYNALYSLLGTAYGGNGTTNFGLPDLRGRLPMSFGDGPGGLSSRIQGQHFGMESVQLLDGNLPSHKHQMFCSPEESNNVTDPTGRGVAAGKRIYADLAASTETLDSESVAMTGLGTKHNNMMPYLAVHFIIALTGDYPPRS